MLIHKSEAFRLLSNPDLEGSDVTEGLARTGIECIDACHCRGRPSFNEVRSEVVKMEHEESSRKHSISSFDSLGKGEERKRVRRSPFSPQLVTYNRIKEASEIEVGSRASRRCSNRTRVSSKSSWRILLGISAPVKTSRAESGRCGHRVRNNEASFERELNGCHALTAPVTHQAQSCGNSTATSF